MNRTLLDGRTVPELPDPAHPLSTKCPGKWALVDMETGDVWNGTTMRRADLADLSLARLIIYHAIQETAEPLTVDGLVLVAPAANHAAIRNFMDGLGGQEWVSKDELAARLGARQVALVEGSGLPLLTALALFFLAVPDPESYNADRPGAAPGA